MRPWLAKASSSPSSSRTGSVEPPVVTHSRWRRSLSTGGWTTKSIRCSCAERSSKKESSSKETNIGQGITAQDVATMNTALRAMRSSPSRRKSMSDELQSAARAAAQLSADQKPQALKSAEAAATDQTKESTSHSKASKGMSIADRQAVHEAPDAGGQADSAPAIAADPERSSAKGKLRVSWGSATPEASASGTANSSDDQPRAAPVERDWKEGKKAQSASERSARRAPSSTFAEEERQGTNDESSSSGHPKLEYTRSTSMKIMTEVSNAGRRGSDFRQHALEDHLAQKPERPPSARAQWKSLRITQAKMRSSAETAGGASSKNAESKTSAGSLPDALLPDVSPRTPNPPPIHAQESDRSVDERFRRDLASLSVDERLGRGVLSPRSQKPSIVKSALKNSEALFSGAAMVTHEGSPSPDAFKAHDDAGVGTQRDGDVLDDVEIQPEITPPSKCSDLSPPSKASGHPKSPSSPNDSGHPQSKSASFLSRKSLTELSHESVWSRRNVGSVRSPPPVGISKNVEEERFPEGAPTGGETSAPSIPSAPQAPRKTRASLITHLGYLRAQARAQKQRVQSRRGATQIEGGCSGLLAFTCLLLVGTIVLLVLRRAASDANVVELQAEFVAREGQHDDDDFVRAANDTTQTLHLGALMSQLSVLAYAHWNATAESPYVGSPFDAGSLHVALRNSCTAFDVVACHSLNYTVGGGGSCGGAHAVTGSVGGGVTSSLQELKGPSFCVFNSSAVGLIVAIRGGLIDDDSAMDAAGHLYTRDVPAATESGTVPVHGGYWDAYNRSGTARLLQELLLEPKFADQPIFLTGHDMGGAIATLAAHDICMQVTLAPGRAVHLFTQGKPYVAGEEFTQSMERLLGEAHCLHTVRRHVLVTDEGLVDPVVDASASAHLMKLSSLNVSWHHEVPRHSLRCVIGIVAQPVPFGMLPASCHSALLYADRLFALTRAGAPAAELSQCEFRQLLPLPYTGLSLCGQTLSDVLLEHSLDPPGTYGYDAYCNAHGEAEGPIMQSFQFAVLVVFIVVISQTILLHMLLAGVLGKCIGRKRWWAGPYFTGFFGFGDGSATPSGLEKLLFSLGMYSASPDLYFDSESNRQLLGPHADPVRIPTVLARQGFRGRSDDPVVRQSVATQGQRHMGRERARTMSLKEFADDSDDRGSTSSRKGSGEYAEEEASAGHETSERPSTWQNMVALPVRMQRRRYAARFSRRKRDDIAGHLAKQLTVDDGYFLGLLLELSESSKARQTRKLAHELSDFMALQKTHVAAIKIQRNLRAHLVRSAIRRRGVIDKVEWAQHNVIFQASDHGREDFRSPLLAAFTLTIGLSQVLAMSPFIPEPEVDIGGPTLIEYSLPFGLGQMFQKLLDILPEKFAPGLSPGKALADASLYIAYGCLWCLINVGNVKSTGVASLWVSTLFLTCYMGWFYFQAQVLEDYDDIRDYESARGNLIKKENFLIGVAILLHWASLVLLFLTWLIYLRWTLGTLAAILTSKAADRKEKELTEIRADLAALTGSRNGPRTAIFGAAHEVSTQNGSARGSGQGGEARRFGWHGVLDGLKTLRETIGSSGTQSDAASTLKQIQRQTRSLNEAVTNRRRRLLMRFFLCVGFKANFRLHVPVVLSAAFITSLLILLSTTAVMVLKIDRLLEVKREVVDFIPKLLQILYERNELLGHDAIENTAAGLTAIMEIARNDFFIIIFLYAGAGVALVLAIRGMLNTLKVYSHTYELLWRAGPAALRFPMRRANSIRFFATFVAFQLCGMVLTIVAFAVLGVLVLLLYNGQFWMGRYLRSFVVALVGLQLTEMLVVRTILVPFFQKLRCGPALFMLELWYLNSGFVKGFTRLLLLWGIPLLSFFTPARCAFIDGMEAWDSGHLTFVCYVMTRVERDKQLVQEKQAAAKQALKEYLEMIRKQEEEQRHHHAEPAASLRVGRKVSMFGVAQGTARRFSPTGFHPPASPRRSMLSPKTPAPRPRRNP